MMTYEQPYRYEVPAGSDDLVGKLLTDVINDSSVNGVDPKDKDQVKELAQTIDDFGSRKDVAVEPLELAKMVVTSRINGWVPAGESLFADWQKAHAGYERLNGEDPTPAVIINVGERQREDEPYGDWMHLIGSDALMLDHVKISPIPAYEPILQPQYEGYGKLFLGHGRVIPSGWPSNLQSQQFLPMLLHSADLEQPVTSEEYYAFGGNRMATLHYALGSKAVLALPDYLHQTGDFSEEVLIKELGMMGVPLRHSELYKDHDFDENERDEQTEKLRLSMINSLLFARTMSMTYYVRGLVAEYGIDPASLADRLEQDFAYIGPYAQGIRRVNDANYNFGYRSPKRELKGVSIALEAWERNVDGFDKELVEHALGVNAPF